MPTDLLKGDQLPLIVPLHDRPRSEWPAWTELSCPLLSGLKHGDRVRDSCGIGIIEVEPNRGVYVNYGHSRSRSLFNRRMTRQLFNKLLSRGDRVLTDWGKRTVHHASDRYCWVATDREVTIVPVLLAQVETAESQAHPPEHLSGGRGVSSAPHRHSKKGEASGYLKQRIGNRQRKNPSVSNYYCYDSPEGRVSRYVPTKKLAEVQAAIAARQPVAAILELLS
jgi:hypothetical protein